MNYQAHVEKYENVLLFIVVFHLFAGVYDVDNALTSVSSFLHINTSRVIVSLLH